MQYPGTPRFELGSQVRMYFGDLLSKYMHDEDNKFGLRVTNRRGDKWIVYGDGQLLKDYNKDTLRLVTEATVKSVQQVLEASVHPTKEQRARLHCGNRYHTTC